MRQACECGLLPVGQKTTLYPVCENVLAYVLDVHADLTTVSDGKDDDVCRMGDVEPQPPLWPGKPRFAENMLAEAQFGGVGVKVLGQDPA